jgi:hypothetical protein
LADLTRSEHRSHALSILDRMTRANHQPGSPTRQGLLLEAQVHATLALTAPESTGIVTPDAVVAEIAPAPAKRVTRGATRKPGTPTPAADETATSTDTEKDTAA